MGELIGRNVKLVALGVKLIGRNVKLVKLTSCLLYTSDAADE